MEKLYYKVNSFDEFKHIINNTEAVLVYFSYEKCNVCKVLKPKIARFFKKKYPKIKMIYTDTVENPKIAGQNSVFNVPTVVVFFDRKEFFRKSRNISLNEINELIKRPYNLIF